MRWRAAWRRRSIVLLKNERDPAARATPHSRLAVIGPNADEVDDAARQLLRHAGAAGDAACRNQRRCRSGHAGAVCAGCDLVEGRQDPRAVPVVDAAFLRPAGDGSAQGLRGEYFRGRELQGDAGLSRIDRTVEFRWDRGAPDDRSRRARRTRRRAARSATTTSRCAGRDRCAARRRDTTNSPLRQTMGSGWIWMGGA